MIMKPAAAVVKQSVRGVKEEGGKGVSDECDASKTALKPFRFP